MGSPVRTAMKHKQNENKMNAATLEEAFSWFVETSKELLILLDSNGGIQYINAALEKALHYNLSEVEGMNFLAFVHEEDQMKSNEWFCTLQNNQSPYTNRVCRKDGTYITVLWRHAKVTKEGYIQVIGELVEEVTINNITFSHFVDLTDEATAIYDLEGRVLLVNEAFEQLYGWKGQEITGLFLPIVPTHLHHELKDICTKIRNGEKSVYPQTVRMKKDGSMVPVSLIASPILDENGTIIAVSTLTKDLTQVLEATRIIETQKELITSQERLLLDITENMSDIVTLYDINQRKLLYVSPFSEQFFGYSMEELYENPQVVRELVELKDWEIMSKCYTAPFDTPLELDYQLKDGRWVHSKITPLVDQHGQNTRIISVSQDITKRKNKGFLLMKREKLSALGQLAAGIAHEIRNPLTTVKGFIQLVAQESPDTYTKIILQEIEQIESIVTEFLMLANPYEEFNFAPHNINNVLTEVMRFMRPEALLHKVEMHTTLRGSPLVFCEPRQIKQVMINIFKNAIEAMPSGGNMYVSTLWLPNGSVVIEVRDEGSGMSKEIIERLGEPLYSNQERGTGLGLMVSYKIIENHRGTIQIDSKCGVGTIVKIILPN